MVYWPSNYGHIHTENDDQRHQILAYPNFVKHPYTVRASPNMPGKASRFRFKHIWPEVAPLCHLHISWTTRKSPWLVSSIFIMSISIRAVWQDKSCHWGAVLSQGLNGKQSSQIELKASKPHWVPKKRVVTPKPVTSKNLGLPNRAWWSPSEFIWK